MVLNFNKKLCKNMDSIISKLGNVQKIDYISEKPINSYSFMVRTNEYFIPLSDSVDTQVELEKLQKELDYTKGFLKSVERKLSNEKFVENAPQLLVEKERKKQVDAKAKIKILAEKITALSDD